jgi:hypothetical protein
MALLQRKMYRETVPGGKNRKNFPLLAPYTFGLPAHATGTDIP